MKRLFLKFNNLKIAFLKISSSIKGPISTIVGIIIIALGFKFNILSIDFWLPLVTLLLTMLESKMFSFTNKFIMFGST